jgi:hypothetical protein
MFAVTDPRSPEVQLPLKGGGPGEGGEGGGGGAGDGPPPPPHTFANEAIGASTHWPARHVAQKHARASVRSAMRHTSVHWRSSGALAETGQHTSR